MRDYRTTGMKACANFWGGDPVFTIILRGNHHPRLEEHNNKNMVLTQRNLLTQQQKHLEVSMGKALSAGSRGKPSKCTPSTYLNSLPLIFLGTHQ